MFLEFVLEFFSGSGMFWGTLEIHELFEVKNAHMRQKLAMDGGLTQYD